MSRSRCSATSHGNVIHLGERECSIQRRNQKIVEEAPSPAVDAALRAGDGRGRRSRSRKAVGYDSAGTVEFILGPDRRFYFLEMNTRLQVEHPVTELVTGIDLVEQMIRVAAGEKLAFAPGRRPHRRLGGRGAPLCRGPVSRLPAVDRPARPLPPAARGPERRRDASGSTAASSEGSEISLWFDPLIAKLVTHGPDRARRSTAMADALDGFVIDGVAHNQPFLSALMEHPRWREGGSRPASSPRNIPTALPAFRRRGNP